MSAKTAGVVYIVGAGPGDPDLITVKGLRAIRRTDVILHDRLVHPDLLAEARADALVLDMGKRVGEEDEQQREIHRLMVAYALEGRTVCRLKGGDPLIFGRGGEEVAALLAANLRFEIVPGVSSITAAAAAAGISLTHRDRTHGFLVITGSRSVKFNSPEWQAASTLLQAGGTVLVMMGLAKLPGIASYLLESGCPAELPAAVVSRATWPNEVVRFGELRNIQSESGGLGTPALLMLGNAIGMARHPL